MVPHLPQGLSQDEMVEAQHQLLKEFLKNITGTLSFLVYTPMALAFTINFLLP